ncbi:hypothetical protein IQ07DRAFT_682730 [Pyrenochaeta sp. DS3sAY3a]|nr:hypothetical protein IQ07DRAFT_682730 [Pyrenochaeta sp. DS3sAY3a]
MSTFKGIVAEFPHIRIDYFRQQPDHKPPLACFLSHVHSDHLAGLESMRAPFLYCSAATREILLRLEKYYYRINVAKGFLESHNVTYSRSMRKLAKPLPLDTPTVIELAPGNSIRVTLLCANHCIGAVMFLIEDDAKAILYTGDIRAETWWVNSLVRNPVMLKYTLGTRRLDCIYLDTTFATKNEPYRDFPSKAEGIQELLKDVSKYPEDTVFYFHSWTFGYEDVWVALSDFLQSRIHLDDYRAGIYGSLSTLDKGQLRNVGLNVPTENKFLRDSGLEIREAPALCGFKNGNHAQPGCLTSEEGVRIHSCERGMGCRVVDGDTNAEIVHIIPIISRANGMDMLELGAGGGQGDLDLKEELETGDSIHVAKLMELCTKAIEDKEVLSKVFTLVQQALKEGNGHLALDLQAQKESNDSIPLQKLIPMLSTQALKAETGEHLRNRTIRFPYSRHSSYSELCFLVAAFNPMDVFPCTVDEAQWTPSKGMRSLFGTHCSSDTFRHDIEMMKLLESRVFNGKRKDPSSDETQRDSQVRLSTSPKRCRLETSTSINLASDDLESGESRIDLGTAHGIEEGIEIRQASTKGQFPVSIISRAVSPTSSIGRGALQMPHRVEGVQKNSSCLGSPPEDLTALTTHTLGNAAALIPSVQDHRRKSKRTSNQQLAYQAAIGLHLTWSDYGGLVSTRSKVDREEQEL